MVYTVRVGLSHESLFFTDSYNGENLYDCKLLRACRNLDLEEVAKALSRDGIQTQTLGNQIVQGTMYTHSLLIAKEQTQLLALYQIADDPQRAAEKFTLLVQEDNPAVPGRPHLLHRVNRTLYGQIPIHVRNSMPVFFYNAMQEEKYLPPTEWSKEGDEPSEWES